MIVFPNCKVNLGLNILSKRADGFHDLETVFYPVFIRDALEIVSPANYIGDTIFTNSGLLINGKKEDNLCIKAYKLLKTIFPQLPSVLIHLHKVIPMGAGLGGGSADAAFSLKILNQIFSLNLSFQQLIELALELGSDCPFFLHNKPCLATKRGEIMNEIKIDLSAYKIVLINPGIHINTGWAFSQIIPSIPGKKISTIIQQPIETWKTELKNDFEEVVFHLHPSVKEIKESLYQQAAVYASLSGSGSTVFGLFEKKTIIDTSIYPKQYFIAESDCKSFPR